jgi:hypothetical protein
MHVNWKTVFLCTYCVIGIATFGYVGDRASVQLNECRAGKRPPDFCKRVQDKVLASVFLAAPLWPAVVSMEAWRLVREANSDRPGSKP